MPQKKHAVGCKFRRAQFGVAFNEEAVVIHRHFEEIGQLLIPVRDNGGGQGDQIGFQFKGTAQNMVLHPNRQLAAIRPRPWVCCPRNSG